MIDLVEIVRAFSELENRVCREWIKRYNEINYSVLAKNDFINVKLYFYFYGSGYLFRSFLKTPSMQELMLYGRLA